MKRLLLVRHAKAVPADASLADSARPLAERGERDGRTMGERLKRREARPDLILASPALRTRRTAELIAFAFDYPAADIVLLDRLYLAEADAILTVIHRQAGAIGSLLIVGHNPGLADLARDLAPLLTLDDLPTGGVVAIEMAVREWAEARDATARLAYVDFPKNKTPATAD